MSKKQPLILSIETATANCSVALHHGGKLLELLELNQPNIHASQTFVFIQEVMNRTGFDFNALDAVAVSKGPGSYTGLRIGVSASKGFCYGLKIPLIGIGTLQNMALSAKEFALNNGYHLLMPMLDARRMEVYSQAFDTDLNPIDAPNAVVLNENSYSNYLNSKKVLFFGNGMEKAKNLLEKNSNSGFLSQIIPTASNTGALAINKFLNNEFEDVAYFEPFYLKEFVSQATFHKR